VSFFLGLDIEASLSQTESQKAPSNSSENSCQQPSLSLSSSPPSLSQLNPIILNTTEIKMISTNLDFAISRLEHLTSENIKSVVYALKTVRTLFPQ
jgi:hypothetical protein